MCSGDSDHTLYSLLPINYPIIILILIVSYIFYRVAYIMNISREIDNFFPGILHYYNIKEWDSEETDLLKYWENTHKFISKVR